VRDREAMRSDRGSKKEMHVRAITSIRKMNGDPAAVTAAPVANSTATIAMTTERSIGHLL